MGDAISPELYGSNLSQDTYDSSFANGLLGSAPNSLKTESWKQKSFSKDPVVWWGKKAQDP